MVVELLEECLYVCFVVFLCCVDEVVVGDVECF